MKLKLQRSLKVSELKVSLGIEETVVEICFGLQRFRLLSVKLLGELGHGGSRTPGIFRKIRRSSSHQKRQRISPELEKEVSTFFNVKEERYFSRS